ncbi:MAG TPA: hypothetical protein VGM88_03135 [Kofleriaceae bacterium]|jgi:hypothetical protein
MVLLALAPLAACGGDDGNSNPDGHVVVPDSPPIDTAPNPDTPAIPDAMQYDFSCFGMSNPTTADDPITVSGAAQYLDIATQGLAAMPDAAIDTFVVGDDDAPIDSTETDATGDFMTGDLATGGEPLNIYAKATKDQYRDTYVFPPGPVAADLANVPIITFQNSTFSIILNVLGTSQDDMHDGMLIFLVTDCSNNLVSDATVTVQQDGASAGDTQPLQGYDGAYLTTNVPPGDVDLTIMAEGKTYPTHTIQAFIGADSITTVRPGP